MTQTKTKKSLKSNHIEDYYIHPTAYFSYDNKINPYPLIDFNRYYRDYGYKYDTSMDQEVWNNFLFAPANPAEEWTMSLNPYNENEKYFHAYDRVIKYCKEKYEPDFFADNIAYGGIATSCFDDDETLQMLYAEAKENARIANELFKTNLVNELSEMWCWNDQERRRQFAYYENMPGIGTNVHIPNWLIGTEFFMEDGIHSLTKPEVIALSYIMQYTISHPDTGYIEASGHIEKLLRCRVNVAHSAIISLYRKGFLLEPCFPPHSMVFNLYRCASWKADMAALKDFTDRYGFVFY